MFYKAPEDSSNLVGLIRAIQVVSQVTHPTDMGYAGPCLRGRVCPVAQGSTLKRPYQAWVKGDSGGNKRPAS